MLFAYGSFCCSPRIDARASCRDRIVDMRCSAWFTRREAGRSRDTGGVGRMPMAELVSKAQVSGLRIGAGPLR